MGVLRLISIFFVYEGVLFLVVAPTFGAEIMRLNLEQVVQIALERNLELKAKREELGIAEGKVIRANLSLQHNPELEGEAGNFKGTRGEPAFARNQTNFAFRLSQELEIGGQSTYRREAAQRNLEKVKLEIGECERTLRFHIT